MNKNTAVMCGGCSAALVIAAVGVVASGAFGGNVRSASVDGMASPGSAARSSVLASAATASFVKTNSTGTEKLVAQPAQVRDRRTAAEAAAALSQAGITPERLAMAGGTMNTMNAALTGAIIQASTSPDDLRTARVGQALRARAASSNYRAALSGNAGSRVARPQGTTQGAATSDGQNVDAADQQAMAAAPPPAGEAVLAAISPVIASRLALMKANSRWNVPERFLLAERTDAEWVSLRDSLASLRISEQRGLPADSVAQGIVDAAESEPVTVAARQRGQSADELRAVMSIVLGGR